MVILVNQFDLMIDTVHILNYNITYKNTKILNPFATVKKRINIIEINILRILILL